MDRKVLCVFALLCFVAIPFLEGAAQGSGRLEIDSPVFGFGTVAQGTVVKHDFEIRNSGDAVLQINKLVPSCGCTASNASKDTLNPGEKAVLSVSFDTSGFEGDKTKTVSVISTDTERQQQTLTLRGRVEAVATASPERIAFGEVTRSGDSVFRSFEVSLNPNSSGRIMEAKSFSSALVITEIGGDSRKKQYSVSLSPDAPIGEFRGRISVGYEDAEKKTGNLNIPVTASVKGSMLLDPPMLSFGIIEGSEPISRTLKLEYRGPGTITIKSISSSESSIKTDFVEVQKGRKFAIHVTVDPANVATDLKASLDIAAIRSDSVEENVSVSVYGVTPAR